VTRSVVRLAAAVLVTAAVGLGVPSTAQADTCSSTHGVTVVVDFHQLGGGVPTFCDASGAGEYADTQFVDAGHTLTYVQNEAFVCRVDGAPSSDPCVRTPPADAYWSLWWSDGKSGTWTYASTGVGSLKVPPGGYVALSWQGGNSQAPPRVAAKAHPTPSPTSTPSPSHPTSRPTHHPTTAPPASPPQASPTTGSSAMPPLASSTATGPTATPLGHRQHGTGSHRRGRDGTAAPTPPTSTLLSSNHAGAASGTAAASSGSGLPGWLAPGLVGLLFVSAAAVAAVRRKRSGAR
jgi:hypothetical protein